jgi:hypothetical protein
MKRQIYQNSRGHKTQERAQLSSSMISSAETGEAVKKDSRQSPSLRHAQSSSSLTEIILSIFCYEILASLVVHNYLFLATGTIFISKAAIGYDLFLHFRGKRNFF